MATIIFNNSLNGIEISFESKPAAAIIDGLKLNGFRWHQVKKLWYAKQTPDRVKFAETLGENKITAAQTARQEAKKINLDNLGSNKPELYGAELSKAIREDLKRRGVSGVSVRKQKSGFNTCITITVKATAADLASIEEAKERYTKSAFTCDMQTHNLYYNFRALDFEEYKEMSEEAQEELYTAYIKKAIESLSRVNVYHMDRGRYYEMTAAFYEKVKAVYMIANQWNYNNSDPMSDYFDVGYYLDIDIETAGTEARETMTDEERAGLKAEREEEARKLEEARKAYEEQKKRDEEAREKYKVWHAEALKSIENNITVEDLGSALYITGLQAGIGKEASYSELLENIEENSERKPQEARTTRKIIFTNPAALDNFNQLYMDDFEFISGKGGTASEDVRINDYNDILKLTKEQRETIKFYNNDCIAVYLNDVLKLVINPEGYSYSRYVYIPTEATEIKDAAEELKKQEEESKTKPAFYIPAPIEEQAEALEIGAAVTVYKCDGWILNNIYAGSGIISKKYNGNYAQYSGVFLELTDGNKTRRVFLRNNNETLIYKGIFGKLPEEVTSRKISANMYEMYNYSELFTNTYNYYKSQGIEPIFDTIPR